MLTRTRKKEYYYDKLHRGFVNACMAATVLTGALVLYTGYMFFTHSAPVHKLKIQEKEKDLLSEGMDLEDTASA